MFAGGRLISLNKTSLEGVTFSDAAAILQSSPDEVELIVSQPKRKSCSVLLLCTQSIPSYSGNNRHSLHVYEGQCPTCLFSPSEFLKDSRSSLSQSTLGLALEKGFGSQTTLCGTEYRPAMDELEEAMTLSNMATPKQSKRLHIPVVRIHDAQVRSSHQLALVRRGRLYVYGINSTRSELMRDYKTTKPG